MPKAYEPSSLEYHGIKRQWFIGTSTAALYEGSQKERVSLRTGGIGRAHG
jgi:hypothetical protein